MTAADRDPREDAALLGRPATIIDVALPGVVMETAATALDGTITVTATVIAALVAAANTMMSGGTAAHPRVVVLPWTTTLLPGADTRTRTVGTTARLLTLTSTGARTTVRPAISLPVMDRTHLVKVPTLVMTIGGVELAAAIGKQFLTSLSTSSSEGASLPYLDTAHYPDDGIIELYKPQDSVETVATRAGGLVRKAATTRLTQLIPKMTF